MNNDELATRTLAQVRAGQALDLSYGWERGYLKRLRHYGAELWKTEHGDLVAMFPQVKAWERYCLENCKSNAFRTAIQAPVKYQRGEREAITTDWGIFAYIGVPPRGARSRWANIYLAYETDATERTQAAAANGEPWESMPGIVVTEEY